MALSRVESTMDVLHKIEKLTKQPENFLGVQNDVAEEITKLTKFLYDYTKKVEDNLVTDALPELIVNDFDEEQIWQELELQNVGKTESLISDISLLVVRKDQLKFPVQNEISENTIEKIEDEMGHSEMSDDDSNIEDTELLNKVEAVDKRPNKNIGVKKCSKSIVDDRFFKLSDLDAFLNNEDRKAKSQVLKQTGDESDGSNDSDDESINLFEDIPSDDSGDEHYNDFFDAPDDDDDINYEIESSDHDDLAGEEYGVESIATGATGSRTHKAAETSAKRVRFLEDDDDVGDVAISPEPRTIQEAKSSFEVRQERLKSRISKLESDALGDKPWQLKGEVSANSRPQNSLLEEVVEFDMTSRPAPIITEQTTLKLEDLIKQRIRDKAWDDVERKVKPVKTPQEYRKQLVLNQEKSKQSLAEVYEEEYIKQRDNLIDAPVEDPPAHQEVRAMMNSLFAKLDALSNFHYTPKPATAEVKIISNIPAISMEEVAPVATANATLLAPEEVKAKPKGDVIGKGERTLTDRKRERRHKKMMQRDRQNDKIKRDKLVTKLKPGLNNKYSKEKTAKLLESVTKEQNVSKMDQSNDTKNMRSSKAFFNQLQEEVTTHIKSQANSNKKRIVEKVSAKRVKL